MYSGQTVEDRKKLRQILADKFPCQTTETIYSNLIQKNATFLTFEDLKKYCALAKIPFESLGPMMAPYGARGVTYMSKKQFVSFFEDELYTSQPVFLLPKTVTAQQAKLLKHIVDSVKKRTEPKFYQMWVFIIKYNPQGCDPNEIRVASICRMAVELEMVDNPKDVVAALFAFFGKKIEAINYDQFVMFVQMFW